MSSKVGIPLAIKASVELFWARKLQFLHRGMKNLLKAFWRQHILYCVKPSPAHKNAPQGRLKTLTEYSLPKMLARGEPVQQTYLMTVSAVQGFSSHSD